MKFQLNAIVLLALASAQVAIAAPIEVAAREAVADTDAAPENYGDYGDYGKYGTYETYTPPPGGYGSYKREAKAAAEPEPVAAKRETTPDDSPDYGSYAAYAPPPGGYKDYPPPTGVFATYGGYKKE